MELTKEDLIAHIENLLDTLDAGESVKTTVTLTALGAEVTLDLSTLNYGALILFDGAIWFKEDVDRWTEPGRGGISQLDFAESIRATGAPDTIFLYNGEVYK